MMQIVLDGIINYQYGNKYAIDDKKTPPKPFFGGSFCFLHALHFLNLKLGYR